MRFTSQGGNAETGYLRLEEENLFFEIKWDSLATKKRKPLSEVTQAFVKQLKKTKKKSIKIVKQDNTRVYRHKAFYVVLKSEIEDVYILGIVMIATG